MIEENRAEMIVKGQSVTRSRSAGGSAAEVGRLFDRVAVSRRFGQARLPELMHMQHRTA